MAADPRVPTVVLDAAVAAAGEVRRHYPHGDRDFRTDVSAMLVAAAEAATRLGAAAAQVASGFDYIVSHYGDQPASV